MKKNFEEGYYVIQKIVCKYCKGEGCDLCLHRGYDKYDVPLQMAMLDIFVQKADGSWEISI